MSNSDSLSTQARSWDFVLHDYTSEDCEAIKEWNYKHMVMGFETCPTTGRPHIQGAVTFTSPKRKSTLIKIDKRISWRPARNLEALLTYCKKSGNFWEDDKREQGARNDLKQVKDILKNGGSLFEAIDSAPSYQTARYAELYMKHMPFRSTWCEREVLWFWGPTGTGKSKHARELDPDLYLKTNYHWWDGYAGQHTVLVDDMRADFCKFHDLLTMIDGYTYSGPVKGGFIPITWKRFIITSAYPPEDLYRERTEEAVAQLLRRITKVQYFGTQVGTGTEVARNTEGDLCTAMTSASSASSTATAVDFNPKPPAAARALASAISRYTACCGDENIF